MELELYATPDSLFGITQAIGQIQDSVLTEPIMARLESCGRSQVWLLEIARELKDMSLNGTASFLQRGVELCQFLSWVCAPMKGNSSWVSINEEAFRLTSDFYEERSLTREPNLQLLCWVVTYSYDKSEMNHPVLMPFYNINSDLVLGYLNMLEHINRHTWDAEGLEVDTTSLTLRLAGIVNALDRDPKLNQAMTQQIRSLKGMIPESDYRIYSDSWIKEFVEIRNAIAHILDSGLGLSLEQAWERSKDLTQVRSIIRLGSYLMANEVRRNLFETPPEHAAAWAERFHEELEWYK